MDPERPGRGKGTATVIYHDPTHERGAPVEPEEQAAEVVQPIETFVTIGSHHLAQDVPLHTLPRHIQEAAARAQAHIAHQTSAGELASSVMVRCQNCVAEGSLVLADGVVRRIEDLSTARQTFVDGIWRQVSAWQEGGQKEVVVVETTHGLRLRVTPDHRIATDRGWVAAADLRSMRGSKRRDSRDELVTMQQTQLAGKDEIDRRDALLIGAIVGDGSFNRFGFQFGFRAAMMEAWKPMLTWAGERLDSAATSRLHHDIAFYNVSWRTKAAMKLALRFNKQHVPDGIWRSTPECMGAYLRGLFSTDGSVGLNPRPAVNFTQTTKSLVDEVRLLLRILGIHSTVSVALRAPRYKDLYTVAIARQRSLERFVELIGFVDERRDGALRAAVTARRGKDKGSPERIRAVLPAGTARVFDLSVPSVESFYANGLLVHNCVHFNPEGWQAIKKDAEASGNKDRLLELNVIRGLVERTQNLRMREMHDDGEGNLLLEHALNSFGVCRALTEHFKETIVVHPVSTCPNDAPFSFKARRNLEDRRNAAIGYDWILRAAQLGGPRR